MNLDISRMSGLYPEPYGEDLPEWFGATFSFWVRRRSVFSLDASFLCSAYSKAFFKRDLTSGSLALSYAALTRWCIRLIIWDWRVCDLDLKDSLDKVSIISCLVENLTFTVSLGSSSVYNLRPEPFGFLPVPVLGSVSDIPPGVSSFSPVSAFVSYPQVPSFTLGNIAILPCLLVLYLTLGKVLDIKALYNLSL